jgi:hypothetical protein
MKNKKIFTILVLITMLCSIINPSIMAVEAEEITINDYINSLNTNINSINYKLEQSKNNISSNDIDYESALLTIESDISNFNNKINNLNNEISNINLSDLVQNNTELNNKYNDYLSKGCNDQTINISNITNINCTYEENNLIISKNFIEKDEIINQIYTNYIKPIKDEIINYNNNYDNKINEYKEIFNNYFDNEYKNTLQTTEITYNKIKDFITNNQTNGNKTNELEVFNSITEDLNTIKNYKTACNINEITNIKNNINTLVTSINNKSTIFYNKNKTYIELGLDTKITDLTNKYNDLINSYKNWLNTKNIDINNITDEQMILNIDNEFSNLFTKIVDITNEYNSLNNEINTYLERMISDKETLNNLMQDLNTINSKLNTNIIFTYIENLIEQSDLSDEDTVDRLIFVKNFQIKESAKEKLINIKNSFYTFNINNYNYKIANDKIILYNIKTIPTDLITNIVYNATFRLENNILYLNDKNDNLLNKYEIVLSGDLNNDYKLDEQDLDLLYQLIVSDEQEQLPLGDLNKDNILDIIDLGLLSDLVNNNQNITTTSSYRITKSIKDNTITYNIYLKSDGEVSGFSYKIKTSKDLTLNKIITNNKVLIKDDLVIGYGSFKDNDLLLSIIYDKNNIKEDYTTFEIYDGIITFNNSYNDSNYKDIVKNIKEETTPTNTNNVTNTNSNNNVVVQDLVESKEETTVTKEKLKDNDKNVTITSLEEENNDKIEWKNVIKVIVVVLLGALIIYFLSKEDNNENNILNE